MSLFYSKMNPSPIWITSHMGRITLLDHNGNSITYAHVRGAQIHGGHWQANTPFPSNSTEAGGTGSGAADENDTTSVIYSNCTFLATQPDPDPPIEDAGIRAGEVIAWRAWRIEKGKLRSAFADTVWHPGLPMEGKPERCGEGVHAWKTRDSAEAYVSTGGFDNYAIGQVELWGEIVEHDKGFRAEFASIVSIDSGDEGAPWKKLKQLRVMYGVGGDEPLPVTKKSTKQKHPGFLYSSAIVTAVICAGGAVLSANDHPVFAAIWLLLSVINIGIAFVNRQMMS